MRKWGVINSQPYSFNAVFFSRVCIEKGIDIVLEVARLMPIIEFHIYGPISNDCFEILYRAIFCTRNVYYHGLFVNDGEAIYRELRNYNVLLFPTGWGGEGVPGVIVESKIAGIPTIASNICYNAEIVHDYSDGIIIRNNTTKDLMDALATIMNDKVLQNKLKDGAIRDSENYFIEGYLDRIICKLQDIV